ncbi:MAG: pyridoxal phosphate-dependent aminotransferase [Planctomycetota bacterium]|nr:pyridoxal phosphate-dependent aminotransferase [Planctomycetota bacterium]
MEARLQLASAVSRLGTETAFEVVNRVGALEAQGQKVLKLHIGAPDFRTPEHIVEAGRKALADGFHGYTPAKGLLPVRESVAEYCTRFHGGKVHPDQVIIVPGGKPTLFYAVLLFGEPGAEIVYPNPGFPIYESAIRWTGATPVPLELREANGFAFSADELLAKITPRTRLIILNSPANPTGGVASKVEMDKLVRGLVNQPHVAVLSDEIYSRLLYDGEKHVSILSYPEIADRAILLDGWSKTYAMTGWRMGFGVWPKSLVDQAERLQINCNSCTNAAAQMAGMEALRGPQDCVDRMHAAFDARRKVIVRELNTIPGFRCGMPKGAFYAFANTSATKIPSRELERRLLQEARVSCLSGTSFGAMGEGFLRFSYASSEETIQLACQRVRELMSQAPAAR